MGLAGNTIEDDAGEVAIVPEIGKAFHEGCDGLALSGCIDDQNYWKAKCNG